MDEINFGEDLLLTTPFAEPWFVMTMWNESAVLDE
jgi:hypothetical protein